MDNNNNNNNNKKNQSEMRRAGARLATFAWTCTNATYTISGLAGIAVRNFRADGIAVQNSRASGNEIKLDNTSENKWDSMHGDKLEKLNLSWRKLYFPTNFAPTMVAQTSQL